MRGITQTTISRTEADRQGPAGAEVQDGWAATRFCAALAADPNPRAAGRGLDPRRRGQGHGNLPSRSAASRLALSGAGAGSRLKRRSATEAVEEAGRKAAGCNRRDDLRTAAAGAIALDDRADCGRSDEARPGRLRRRRDNSTVACEPRLEAVAGKKCGASRRSTPSTSERWRTCWI